jgi:hypothetical protein
VPSLGTRETLAFGTGMPLPTRLTFAELPEDKVPRSEAFAKGSRMQSADGDLSFIASVIERWRTIGMSSSADAHGEKEDLEPAPRPSGQSSAAAANVDPGRLGLLRRPAAEQPDPYARLQRPTSAPQSR